MAGLNALRGVHVQVHENVEHSQRRENVIYRDQIRVVELLLQLRELENKNVENQHKHMYSLYIDSLSINSTSVMTIFHTELSVLAALNL